MPPKRVPDRRVLEAIKAWRGNVSAAAREVGITRHNMHKRLDALVVDLAALRREAPKGETMAKADPIRPAVVRRGPVRLRPELEDRLREAKYDLQARYRVETHEGAILEQFFEEAFEGWLAAKLA